MPGTCRGGGAGRAARPPVAAASAGMLRPVRAAGAAVVCVATTALGHAFMSSDLLPWWTLALGFTTTASGAWWLTGRERGAATVVGATVLAQALLHLLFDMAHTLVRGTAGPAAGTDHTMTFSHAGMAMHMDHSMPGMGMQHAGTTGVSGTSPLESLLARQGSMGMVVAHLLAAVVCGLWLWRGETAAHRLGRALAVSLFAPLRRARRLLARTGCDGRAPAFRSWDGGAVAFPTASDVLRHAVVRRGPPRAGSALRRRSTGSPACVRP
ncbi:hypothetical protein [Streptomyces antibioticus]|uniref:hypothetical protein n=1 Tax=Streptomyces antibioticus TaxID=1890 RepID=UPI0033ED1845